MRPGHKSLRRLSGELRRPRPGSILALPQLRPAFPISYPWRHALVAESKPARPSSNGASIDQRRDMALLSLARVATILNAEHDPDKSLETICREALALFNVGSAIIWEREGDYLVVKQSAGELETILRDLRVALDDPVSYSGECFRRQVPTLQKRAPIVENWGDRGVQRPSSAEVLCVPMLL